MGERGRGEADSHHEPRTLNGVWGLVSPRVGGGETEVRKMGVRSRENGPMGEGR